MRKREAASSTLLMEDEVSKSKRRFSDLSAGTSGKRSKLTRRQSRDETTIPSVTRKLFNSTEMEEETQEGHNLEELEEDIFSSKILEEGAGDSEVIAAFESFTQVLKKKFWSRYKRMAIYTQNVMRTSEQHILALLNQIHQSQLNELERFHKTVAQELSNLEKRTRFLSNLEKDTLEFWTKQSNILNKKMNNFCIRQMQRIQSMDSELEGAAKNLEDAAQNGKFEEAVDHEEERSKASVIASD
ncbi:synaptonemal complex protein 2-like [Lacerta agilis]|uniref:synaptonemal complex protein 2-like n=1 Tax=Lacerta agilis TaxID=80427 RepID=UPI0014193856|nr:synaptonemal complex protein 2-like [Lacerta agilis]